MDEKFSPMCEADIQGGRPSIAPEKAMRAMLLQVCADAQGLDDQDALPVKPLRRRAPSSRQFFLVFEVCIAAFSLGII